MLEQKINTLTPTNTERQGHDVKNMASNKTTVRLQLLENNDQPKNRIFIHEFQFLSVLYQRVLFLEHQKKKLHRQTVLPFTTMKLNNIHDTDTIKTTSKFTHAPYQMG